jgi:hypothetical protein
VTNADYTALLFIVDRSGSMASIAADMEGGIKTLLDEQRQLPGRLTVDFVRFDDKYEHVSRLADPDKVVIKITPRGSTALLDAVGRAVTEFGATLAAMPEEERPGQVIVAIVTDGLENASHEWTGAAVKALVEQQTFTYSWTFTYLGANQDADSVAHHIGINPSAALTYNPANVGAMASSLSGYVSTTRSTGVAASYSVADREANAAPAPKIDGVVIEDLADAED